MHSLLTPMSETSPLNRHPFTEIVPIFSGGGTRLPCYVGILKALEQLHVSYQHVVGVSGGSIVAALLAAGHDLAHIQRLVMETDYRQFRHYSFLELVRHGGLCNGNYFESWLDQQLGGMTFSQLPMDLYVLATDIRSGAAVVFSKATTPHTKVSAAVRCSMSIPLLYSFKRYGDQLLTDGVILADEMLHQDWSTRGIPVICFRLRSHSVIRAKATPRFFPLVHYFTLLTQTLMNALSRDFIATKYWSQTVVVHTDPIGSVNFKLTRAQKEFLATLGYDTTLQVLQHKTVVSARKSSTTAMVNAESWPEYDSKTQQAATSECF
jgi:NTE family protein